MLVVTALGGNALLRRGQAMTAANQRENVRIAAQSLAPVALEHDPPAVDVGGLRR